MDDILSWLLHNLRITYTKYSLVKLQIQLQDVEYPVDMVVSI